MERTAVRGRLSWQVAGVVSVTWETASVATIQLDPPDWAGHRAGQHLDVRLTAEDGYVAERSYSIASAPGEPLRSMLRHRVNSGSDVPARLLYSSRGWEDVIYRDELGQYQDGALVVYQRAPGAVVRYRTCGNVVMVLVKRADSRPARRVPVATYLLSHNFCDRSGLIRKLFCSYGCETPSC